MVVETPDDPAIAEQAALHDGGSCPASAEQAALHALVYQCEGACGSFPPCPCASYPSCPSYLSAPSRPSQLFGPGGIARYNLVLLISQSVSEV